VSKLGIVLSAAQDSNFKNVSSVCNLGSNMSRFGNYCGPSISLRCPCNTSTPVHSTVTLQDLGILRNPSTVYFVIHSTVSDVGYDLA
jgi:hypothetical protein